ncbi:MAG: hypothetical protein EA400_01590 [Chromatiaceae bacterium]|nr:MAG: hypothetical protein EA400_01590 [Chromatiaceae bacterium]
MGAAAGERGIDLEAADAEGVDEMLVEALGAERQGPLVRHRDGLDLDAGGARLLDMLGQDLVVVAGVLARPMPIAVGIVHRGTDLVAEHRADHVVPARTVANQVGLQAMVDGQSACGGGRTDQIMGRGEPRRRQRHHLATLPVNRQGADVRGDQVIQYLVDQHPQPG